MTKKKISSVLSVDNVCSMSYTDFIGLVNQWNVLPGSYVSLNKWRHFGDINSKSNILEVACTTGFSSRELAYMTGCKGIGFDISAPSIEQAKLNKKIYKKKIDIEYVVSDGYAFKTKVKFSHIIVGAALRFFSDPANMLMRLISVLQEPGYILATEFYTVKPIPKKLIKDAQGTFGITPTTIAYKEVMKIYESLEVVYEDRNIPVQETDAEINYYTKSTIDRACARLKITDKVIYNAMFDRLKKIKQVSNALREYQGYNVLVLRKRSETYPNRYTELF